MASIIFSLICAFLIWVYVSEANGGETNAEKEARELAEREQKEREAVAVMRMRRNRLALQNRDIETFSY